MRVHVGVGQQPEFFRRARRPLRPERERRAGVHRRVAAPAGERAGGAAGAGCARLPGPGRGDAAPHHHRGRQQRAAARPPTCGRRVADAQPAGRTACPRRRGDGGDRRALHGGPASRGRGGGDRAAGRGRDVVDAVVPDVVPGRRGDRRVPRARSVPAPLAARRRTRQRTAGRRPATRGTTPGAVTSPARSTC